MELPEYDVRRLILARDPLCAVDAFTVLVRVVLARLLGTRMCPNCPHCNKGGSPCQDRFGSNAEPMGGVFGRSDAIFDAVETQRSGTLHFHFLVFIQRAHQHKTLREIADMVRQGLLSAQSLKEYHCYVSRETYPDVAKQEAEADIVEKQWPTFRDDRQLGQIPGFIWRDTGPHLLTEGASRDELLADGAEWKRRYNEAAQHRMARVQHHLHKKIIGRAAAPAASVPLLGEATDASTITPWTSASPPRPLWCAHASPRSTTSVSPVSAKLLAASWAGGTAHGSMEPRRRSSSASGSTLTRPLTTACPS